MRRRVPVLAAAGVAVLLGVTAVAVTDARDDEGFAGRGMMAADGFSGPGHLWQARSEAAYLAEMVVHHREAVASARELSRSERPQMRALGSSIVAGQTAQIVQMEGWLARWYPAADRDVDYRPMMRDLSGLSGDDLDRTFLEDMLTHHMAAVMSSQHLVMRDEDEHPEVARLARSIRDDQHAEMVRMQRWLREWFGRSW